MNKNDVLQNNIKLLDEATKEIKQFMSGVLDAGSFVETDVFLSGKSFVSGLEGMGEGVVTGYATIDGDPVQIFAQNQAVLKGSLGAAHAQKIVKCIDQAIYNGTPLISVIDTSGARVGEGVAMLEGYAKVIEAAVRAKSEVPHICIIKGNSVGMMSSFAALADFVFMSEESVFSFSSPMVLASKSKDYPSFKNILGVKKQVENGLSVNFSFKNAQDLSVQLQTLLSVLLTKEQQNTDDPNRETPALNDSISADALLKAVCDNGKFIEVNAAYAKDVRCVLTKINGISAGLVISNTNGAEITLKGLKKARKFIEKLNDYDLPLINFVDFSGIASELEEELGGSANKIAKFMQTIAETTNDKISVITGKAIGAVYTALASKSLGYRYTLAFAGAEIAPVNSETAVNVLYADELKKAKNPIDAREKLQSRYVEMEANPFVSAKEGFVDNIILPSTIRPYLSSALMMLLGI